MFMDAREQPLLAPAEPNVPVDEYVEPSISLR
jgi:hypothetical protein